MQPFIHLCICLLLITLNPLLGKSQVAESSLILHLDKGFYVTGEVIWFKVYFPSHWEEETFLTLSIFDASGLEIESFGLSAGGDPYIPGYFPIPYEWNTGWYQFVLSGVQKKDAEPYELLRAQLPIYNDLRELPNNLEIRPLAKEDKIEADYAGDLEIVLEPFPSSISPGDSISIGFQVKDQAGKPLKATASVSIYDDKLVGLSAWDGPNVFWGKVFPSDFEVYEHPVLKGALFHLDGTPYLTNFFGAYEPLRKKFHYDVEYDLNYFTQSFPVSYESLEVQFMDFLEGELDIRLLSLPGPGPVQEGPSLFTPGILAYLTESAKRKKIYRLFNSVEVQLPFQSESFQPLTWEPDRRFILDAYEDFENLPSLLYEISTPLKFKSQKSGGYQAQMFNPEFGARTFYPGTPLFVIDGKLTRNDQFIADLDIELIDTLDLYYYFENLNQKFGVLGHNGLVHIQTHGPGVELPPEDPFYSYQMPALLPKLNAYKSPAIPEGVPHLGPLQYWNAELQTNAEGKGHFTFKQGDYPGSFVIKICVLTEKGYFGVKQSLYTVDLPLSGSRD